MPLFDNAFTLGVEEEYQIVDPVDRELRSYISKLIDEGSHSVLRERVRSEMHQSMVEVGTGICRDIEGVRAELTEMRGDLDRLARNGGLRIIAASTHPFSDWQAQRITENPRYYEIVEDLQDVARANLIFGLHVHVGIRDKQVALAMANQLRYFLPHILCLTCSSPFWKGRKTGLMSYRSQVFKRFPRTGIPDEFESVEQLKNFINLLIRTRCIDNGKKIWWDVRTHWRFDTVEVRISDIPTNLEDTLAVVALIQALVAQLYMMHKRNISWRSYPRSLIEENKWRAARYGTDAKLIDLGVGEERPFAELAHELVEFVSDAAEALGTVDYLQGVLRIAKEGTSAHRQLEVHEKSGGDLNAVVDFLIEETMRGI